MSTTETTAPAATATQQRPKAIREQFPIGNNQLAWFESVLWLNNANTIKEFSEQYAALDNQVKRIFVLNQRIQQALTTPEKDALAKVREQEVRDLEAKDGLFAKVYGIRVANYAGRIGKIKPIAINLLLPATDEEIAEARKDAKFKEENLVVRGDRKLLVQSTMTGEHVALFERNVNLVQAQRANLIQLKAAADQASGEAKAKLEEQLKRDEETLTKNNEEMIKTYGFSLTRNYAVDVLAGIFFVSMTQEEFDRAVAQQQAEAAETPKAEAKKDKPAKAN